MKNYTLTWIQYWDDKSELQDKSISLLRTVQPDGRYEDECTVRFSATDDKSAIEHAKEYIDNSIESIEVFTVKNEDTDEEILTEEN